MLRMKKRPHDAMNPQDSVKHKDIVSESLKLVDQVEQRLQCKVFKFCENAEQEINKAIGSLSDCQILSSLDKDLLVEEKRSAKIASMLEMDPEDTERNMLDTRRYRVDPFNKNPEAKIYVNIMKSVNIEH